MKIAILTDTYFPQINGVSTSTQTFAEEFEKLGHGVIILGPGMAGAMESTSKIWRFKSMVFPFQKEYRVILPLSRQLRQFPSLEVDIIHAQTPFSMGRLALYLGWKNKIPVVHTYHTYFEEYLHYLPILPTWMLQKAASRDARRFCNACDAVVAPSTAMKQVLERYKVETPISVIPTGVPLDSISITTDRAAYRKALGWSDDHKIVIYVGRLGEEKNLTLLMSSFEQVAAAVPLARLLIVGDGPNRKEVAQWISVNSLANRVLCLGYVPHQDVFTAFAAADVIAFPSKTETQGLSLLEGLAVGIPAVGVRAMGVVDILGDERGGFLVDGSTAAFTDKLIALLTDDVLHREKSAGAFETAERFSARKTAGQMLDLYEHVIATSRKKR